MEVSLEKMMLILVGLCFASLICVPLIENGVTQVRDQYAYSQFERLVNSIDSGIAMVLNSTGQKPFQEEFLIPSTVAINSSINKVTYSFKANSMKTTIIKEYPINVNLSFNYPSGWYRVGIQFENSSLITVSFTQIESP